MSTGCEPQVEVSHLVDVCQVHSRVLVYGAVCRDSRHQGRQRGQTHAELAREQGAASPGRQAAGNIVLRTVRFHINNIVGQQQIYC